MVITAIIIGAVITAVVVGAVITAIIIGAVVTAVITGAVVTAVTFGAVVTAISIGAAITAVIIGAVVTAVIIGAVIKPDQVSVSDWRESLRTAWLFGNHLNINWDALGIQESWDLFMEALNSMFFLALQDQVRKGNLSFDEFQSRIKGAVPKGGIPFWEERFWSRSARTFSGSMKVLKLRKKLARLFEFKRLLARSGSEVQTQDVLQNLAKKLRYFDVSVQILPEVVQHISRVKQELQDTETETRKQKLKKWKEHITNDHEELGRWLKARDRPNIRAVAFNNKTCHQPKEISREIIGFWERFWENPGYNDDSDVVLDNFGVSFPQGVLTPPNLDTLLQVFRGKDFGSAGGDGWKGCESISLFRILALKWESSQMLPEAMFHSRMVNLPKNKVVNGILSEQSIRPITVLNAFWRIWGSAWNRTPQVISWIRDQLPRQIIFGKGSDAAVGAAELFSFFPPFGFGRPSIMLRRTILCILGVPLCRPLPRVCFAACRLGRSGAL